MMTKLLVLAIALSLSVLFVGSAQAGHGRSWQVAKQEQRQPLAETVKKHRKDKRGRVLAAEPKKRNGKEVHRLRVISDDGRVRTLVIDPETGREIKR